MSKEHPRRGMTVFGVVLAMLLISALALFANVEPGAPAATPGVEDTQGVSED